MKRKIQYLIDLVTSNALATNAIQAIPFWVASLAVGLLTVLYTWLFEYAEYWLHQSLKWNSWSIFLLTPLCFFIAWFIVVLFAPNAKGSGIPQVMAAIDLSSEKEEKKLNLLLGVRILIVKIVSSVLMVLGGASIGREGPTIQISSSVFYVVRRWLPASWPKLSNQAFILTGAAAGLAAAFNTPLGGLVFAMEELSRIHIRFFRTALFSAVIIAGLTAQALLGSYLYLGYPDVRHLQFSVFFSVALVALVAGILGALSGKAIIVVNRWKANFSRMKSLIFLLAIAFAFAATAVFIDENILGSGKDIMNNALFTREKYVSFETMILRIIGPILCFNVGAAGGIFAPALAAGATVGSYVSFLIDASGANANMLMLAGMVGFLTGITRTPFTSAILVLEMTDRHSVIFHLLVAALVSNLAALLIDKRSVYEHLKESYLTETDTGEKTGTAKI